jgi:hypothetical protein
MAVELVDHTDRVDAYMDLPLARRGNQQSRRTLRDGSHGDTFPGTSCLATIIKSLRDTASALKMSKIQGELLAATGSCKQRRSSEMKKPSLS